MSKYKSQGIYSAFKNASKGIVLAVKSELNIKIHLVAAVLVILFAIFLKMNVTKICILLIAISNVLVAEIINTSIEFGLDAVFHNKYSKLVGFAKDISAGAVVMATIISVIIGLLIFGAEFLKICSIQLY